MSRTAAEVLVVQAVHFDRCGYLDRHHFERLVQAVATALSSPPLSVATETEIAAYYWPKDSMPSDEPAEWFLAAIRDAFDAGATWAAREITHPEAK